MSGRVAGVSKHRGGIGTRGGRGRKPQRGSRMVPSEADVIARNASRDPRKEDSSSGAEEETTGSLKLQDPPEENPRELDRADPQDDDSDRNDSMMICNPNRNPEAREGPPELSRREREAVEKQKHAELMQRLQAEGKTSRAKADLERLAEVRRRRAEAERVRSQASKNP